MPVSSSPRRTVLALILAAACWGIGTVVSKHAIDEIPPLTLLPIQLAASLAVLGLLMRVRGLPLRDRSASPILGRLGVLNPGLAYALSLLGLVNITASLSVMLWAIEPLLILFLAGWFLRERIGPSLIILSLVAVTGMLLVIYQPGSTGSPIGILLTVAGVACCAAYTVVSRVGWPRPTRRRRSSWPSRPTPSPLRSPSLRRSGCSAAPFGPTTCRPPAGPARSDPASSTTAWRTGCTCRRYGTCRPRSPRSRSI